MDIPKVKVRMSNRHSNNLFSKHWWIRCSLCKTKIHVRRSRWPLAINTADIHARGKQHVTNLIKLNADKIWESTFASN